MRTSRTKRQGSASLARAAEQTKGALKRRAARAAELLDLISRRVQRIEEDFFDIGAALHELKDKKLHIALGFRTFDEMLAKRAPIGRTQAYKLMAIVQKVSRAQALRLGEEKAYAVAQLVAATPDADSVASIIEGGVPVGKSRRPAATMSRREIDAVKRTLVRQKSPPKPDEVDARRTARAAQARLLARGVAAKIEITRHGGKWWAVVRVPVAALPHLFVER